jgi:uncharacterized membrane protein YfcA
LALALSGDIASLARATSVLLLMCFTFVNVALLILKRHDHQGRGSFEVPAFVPVCGAVISVAMLTQSKIEELKIAGAIVLVIVALYFVLKPKDSAIAKMDT